MHQREQIIRNYINAYNNFDIDGMVSDFDPAVTFENSSNGEINLSLKGLPAFKEQAEQAKNLFSKRQQTIKSFKHHPDRTEIEIGYKAVLAVDLPNGLKKNEELNLTGRSIFTFSDTKVIALSDLS